MDTNTFYSRPAAGRLRRWLGGLLLLLGLMTGPTVFGQTLDWQSAASVNPQPNSGQLDGVGMGTDASGNEYVAGFGHFSAGFKVGFGATQLFINNGSSYVAARSAAGAWLWACTIDNAQVGTLAVNKSTGDVFVSGFRASYATSNTLTFANATGGGTQTLTLVQNQQFIAKISAAGTWQWARFSTDAAGMGPGLSVSSLDVDAGTGTVYAAGYSGSAILFKDGAGATVLTAPLASGTYNYNGDALVAKLSSSGQWQWARRLGDHGTQFKSANGLAAAASSAGGVALGGTFAGSPSCYDASGQPVSGLGLSSPGGSGLFVAQLDANGTWQWSRCAENSFSGAAVVSLVRHPTDNSLYFAATGSATLRDAGGAVVTGAGFTTSGGSYGVAQ